MKEVTLIEMDGFLKGKCIPRDLKVNETNAEYLVRKFAEAEAKCAALAAENAALKKSDVEFNEYCRRECEDVGDTWEDDFTDTPATDAFWMKCVRRRLMTFARRSLRTLRLSGWTMATSLR
ncbi:hypothetical protein LT311_06810 [Salmonella enterica]|nr:hypothetical protein [Salmonella enterica]UGT32207.1 hypothetical protein LT311_06810 [Salmonella enterica]